MSRPQPGWATIPNLLTLLRIALTPWIGFEIARDNYPLALPLLFFAGMSDAADGFLARRLGWQSKLGAKLDPLADKLLTATVFIALAANGRLPLWMLALAFGRDLLILSFSLWALRSGIRAGLQPTLWGKLSTALQLLLAGGLVMEPALALTWFRSLYPPLLAATAAMTLFSGLDYARIGWKLLRRHRRQAD